MLKTDRISHFLLIYDRLEGRLVDVEKFGADSDKAVARYQEVEALHRENPRMDIVLVGSDSLETVRVTHANYFAAEPAVRQVEEFLRELTNRR